MERIVCIFTFLIIGILQDACVHPQVERGLEVVSNKRKDNAMYIYGGTEAMPREFPHMAAVGFILHFRKNWLCGGSLINKRFVLTAAHCLEDMDYRTYGKAVLVRLGDIDLKNSSDDAEVQEIRVMQRIPHPNYTYPMKYNDIGLLKLREDAIFNQFVQPACLHNAYNIMGTQAEVVGWGTTEKGRAAIGQKLYKVVIDVHNIEKCTEVVDRMNVRVRMMYLKDNLLDESMLCAGVIAGGKDSCTGDSGGPLQIKSSVPGCYVDVIGIVSFGIGDCGVANTPAVYVRVSPYVPWLERIINSSV